MSRLCAFVRRSCASALACTTLLSCAQSHAQWMPYDQLPNSARVREVDGASRGGGGVGRVGEVRWDSKQGRLWWEYAGKWKNVAVTGGEVSTEGDPPDAAEAKDRGYREPRGARGMQATSVPSPDGKWTAVFADSNVQLQPVARSDKTDKDSQESKDPKESKDEEPAKGPSPELTPVKVTTEGTGKLKYGSADWVYAEELDQNTAMWWAPDSSKLAYYAFDERPVQDYWLVGGLTQTRTRPIVAGYPKAGERNGLAKLEIYDLASKRRVPVDVGAEPDQYIYGARWTPKGDGLLFYRTNRHQDVLELMYANPATGQTRALITERQATWQNNSPRMQFLEDGSRFIWETEANGYSNFQLWDLAKGKIADLTVDPFVADRIELVDEKAGWLYYTARSSETKINPQLHRVRLDGTDRQRLTKEDMYWSGFKISPDHNAFVATKEFVDKPPQTGLYGMDGTERAVLAKPAADYFTKRKLTPPEFLRIKSADGTAELYGVLHKPADYDPKRKYPLVLNVYGGPGINLVNGRFQPADGETEFGVLVAKLDNRGTPGRGKAFESATYQALGVKDVDDQAQLVKELIARGIVEPGKVAVAGHSYGGYMTLMCMLRYPDVFAVGVAGAPPSDWRQYDTIYTERYMRTPQENEKGYDAGSAVKLARNLKGKVMLLHGMVDDNVHPANTFAIADQWQKNNTPFEMMLFPTSTHGINSPAHESVKWSFILRHLGLLDGDAATAKRAAAEPVAQ